MNDIGLNELIEQVKHELMNPPVDDNRLFVVGKIELELAVTITMTANGKSDLKVVAVGGDTGSERVQRVTVTLEPLVSVDDMRAQYRRLHPEPMAVIAETFVRGEEEEK